jgi:hypothetical protein
MTTATAEVVTVSGGYPVHPVAEMFPLITGAEFDLFVEDVRANGLMEPVVLDTDGRLIDGRNRMRACIELDIEPSTKVFDGSDVTAYIVSHNIHRRHLTDSQRAMIAAKLATRPPGYRTEIVKSHLSHMTQVIPPSRSEAAELLNVSGTAVARAKKVLRDGLPALQELVSEGRAPVTTAARVATDLSFPEQQEYVEKVRAGTDPVRAAPPDLKQQAKDRTRAEKAGKETPKTNGAKHADVIAAVNNTLRVWRENNLTFTELDSSVTAEEATRLTGDLSKSITVLRRINDLLRKRSQ